jgi:hypothetical protein
MNSQAKDRDALAAATRSDVNGLKHLPERQLLPLCCRSWKVPSTEEMRYMRPFLDD